SISMRRRQLTWLVLGVETPQQRAAVRAVSDAVSGGIDIGDCGGLTFRGFKSADLAVVVEIRCALARALLAARADDDVVVVDSCGSEAIDVGKFVVRFAEGPQSCPGTPVMCISDMELSV